MASPSHGFLGRLLHRSGMRFPGLFSLFAILTAVDLVVPDVVPFVDELGLAVLTALFWSWRDRRADLRETPSR